MGGGLTLLLAPGYGFGAASVNYGTAGKAAYALHASPHTAAPFLGVASP